MVDGDLSGARVALIGAGGIGRTHLRAWQSIGVTPVLIADVDGSVAAKAAEEYGGSAAAVEDVFASSEVDLVAVCTPPAAHAALAVAALEAGRGVFCEKPLGRTLDDAQRVVEAAAGGFAAVGFCHRFQPEIVALKQLIDDGRLGEIRSFRNRFSARLTAVESRWFSDPSLSGGGVLMDTSVHSVDLFRHLVGEPVVVRALASIWPSREGPALTVEDTAAMTVMTASGAIGVIDASWRTPAGTAIVEVEGTEGSAVADYSARQLRVNIGGTGWQEAPLVEQNRFAAQARDVLEALRDRRAPRAGVHDGLRANEVLDAAYRSIAAS